MESDRAAAVNSDLVAASNSDQAAASARNLDPEMYRPRALKIAQSYKSHPHSHAYRETVSDWYKTLVQLFTSAPETDQRKNLNHHRVDAMESLPKNSLPPHTRP
jgi:hypothetical protein